MKAGSKYGLSLIAAAALLPSAAGFIITSHELSYRYAIISLCAASFLFFTRNPKRPDKWAVLQAPVITIVALMLAMGFFKPERSFDSFVGNSLSWMVMPALIIGSAAGLLAGGLSLKDRSTPDPLISYGAALLTILFLAGMQVLLHIVFSLSLFSGPHPSPNSRLWLILVTFLMVIFTVRGILSDERTDRFAHIFIFLVLIAGSIMPLGNVYTTLRLINRATSAIESKEKNVADKTLTLAENMAETLELRPLMIRVASKRVQFLETFQGEEKRCGNREEILDRLLIFDPNNRWARRKRGDLSLEQGDIANAVKQYSFLLDNQAYDKEAVNRLGGIIIRAKKWPLLASIVSRYNLSEIGALPLTADEEVQLGLALSDAGDLKIARVYLAEAARHIDSAAVSMELGYIEMKLLDFGQAETHFRRALSLSAGELIPGLDYQLGLIALHKERLDEAVEHFRKELVRNPRHVGALEQLERLKQKTPRLDTGFDERRMIGEILPLPRLDQKISTKLNLAAVAIEPNPAKPGSRITVTMYYEPQSPIYFDHAVWLHLDRGFYVENRIQHHYVPLENTRPMTRWMPGEIVVDTILLEIGRRANRGNYYLQVGWDNFKPGWEYRPILDILDVYNARLYRKYETRARNYELRIMNAEL